LKIGHSNPIKALRHKQKWALTSFFAWFFNIVKQAKTDIDGRVVYDFREPEYLIKYIN
jgi:hypothetical protein